MHKYDSHSSDQVCANQDSYMTINYSLKTKCYWKQCLLCIRMELPSPKNYQQFRIHPTKGAILRKTKYDLGGNAKWTNHTVHNKKN